MAEAAPPGCRVAVAVDAPRHTGLGTLDYLSQETLAPGTLVLVPFGKREVPGLVWDAASEPASTAAPPFALRAISGVLTALPPLPAEWRSLINFAAAYYQRGVGELALAVLPPELRKLDNTRLARRVAKLLQPGAALRAADVYEAAAPEGEINAPPVLSEDQRAALAALAALAAGGTGERADADSADAAKADPDPAPAAGAAATGAEPPAAALRRAPRPVLLHGVTGSGKTEVYLHATEAALQQGRQALVLVPEINLTPQLEARFAARFPGRVLASLHSGLTPVQRLRNWLLAHLGLADLVLGTRMAIFVPLPRLGLVVVDEEHDPSFKQQEGARYSARDLAVWRAHQLKIPVVLGSATPSLETWQRVQEGRYLRLPLEVRIGGGAMPQVRMVDMGRAFQHLPSQSEKDRVLAPALRRAIEERLARGEQSLLLLNRRGYAPVLHCGACGWRSGCPHCSAWRVFHKNDRTLRCHHCSLSERVPRACPDCGNLDIVPVGRGTEKLQEQLAALLPQARVGRIDADSTRAVGSLQQQLKAVHDGEVDVIVGTQMIAKGHDFRRVTLVAAVNPDSALFSSDFRAPERLFALLMQAAGRAGRDAQVASSSEMWVQSGVCDHPLFAALVAHDYERFARQQLSERKMAGLPPFSALALVRADARTAEAALQFLQQARVAAQGCADVTVYPPVPPPVAKVADVERMQMLLECPSRVALQRMLAQWLPQLDALRGRHKGLLRWAVDVDPLAI
jgi:primosomal protein N' (replication factor Y) (superfamily II helicase)